ncbi:hypothetical protein [Nesterenkonia halotolerans]|uniref:Uncharacterized protein n=1 Tax=Nesterenkonia halotolerans TaxID=225325 RepID=A0ABR9J8T2_9MICC|nr:hypothetical protein [Nesterenkonia halotolerans]MBE1515388.1 hypothetical protein [Nesterenkonia halotolerans]
MSTQSFDPWSSGTRAYRVTLVTGMAATGIGVVLVILAAVMEPADGAGSLRSFGLFCLAAGILSHLIAIGLRRRQAAQVLSRRASEED